MNVGIVGHEAKKFTPDTEADARAIIQKILEPLGPYDRVVSGRSPLGGIDLWAEEEAAKLGLSTLIFPPQTHEWATGYKPRNLRIAETSDIVHCLVVRVLPPSYTGMRFDFCYHCKTDTHVKSGGCWTAKRCVAQQWHVIG